MTTTNHKFEGNVTYASGQSFYVYFDECRTDEYQENNGQQSYRRTYHLQSRDNPINVEQARVISVYIIKTLSLLRQYSLPLTTFNITHNETEDLDYLWEIELEWRSTEASNNDTNFEKYKVPYTLNEAFETGGGQAHITQAYDSGVSSYGETVYQVDSSDPGPSSFRGQIGWNGETAEGCDVIRPAFSVTLHKRMTADEMTQTYREKLTLLTGCVNNASYYGFSAGNLLLESVSASTSVEYKEEDITVTSGQITWAYRLYYDITFKFRGGIEFTNLPVGGVLINKKAHQYVWTYYEKYDDSTAGITFQKPKSVIVNDVYPSADFTQLNIFGELDQE